MTDPPPSPIDLNWVGRTLRSVQAEQRSLRSLIEPIPPRLTALEARFSALEARFSGVEEALNAIQLTLRSMEDKLQ